MKSRFRLFRRGQVFYAHDNDTGQQTSLRTKDEGEAQALLHSRNEAHRQPVLNLQIARTYLTASDPEIAKRTWQIVMDEMGKTKHGPTKHRHDTAMRDKAFDSIRTMPLLETQAHHFLHVLSGGTVSTNMFLVRLHNFALQMNWLLADDDPFRRRHDSATLLKRAMREQYPVTLNQSIRALHELRRSGLITRVDSDGVQRRYALTQQGQQVAQWMRRRR